MISELIVTSAPRGLQAGRSGFTTVCRTRGIHPDLASRLEAASAYRHVFPQGDQRNPVIFSYTVKPSSLGEVWVLSRVGDAGTDYTGRSNKIAHHIALQQVDLPQFADSNPAAVIAALASKGGLLTSWSGEPRENAASPQLPSPATPPGPCQRWASIAGDAGWAGVLVERALKREATWVVAPHGTDLLGLFSEALALVSPSQRWQIPFTTYSLRGDEGRWLGVIAGSPEAEAAIAQKRIAVMDLTRPSTAPEGGPYVSAARGRAGLPWQRATPLARSNPAEQTPQRQTSAHSLVGSQGEPRTQHKTPPALMPSASIPHSRPPELTEWEDVELQRPKSNRLVLIGAFGAALAAIMLLPLAYGAYALNWLPAGMKESIEIVAWRKNLPLVEHRKPGHVAATIKSQQQLKDVFTQVGKLLKAEDLAGHPAFEDLLAESESVLRDLATATAEPAVRVATEGQLQELAKKADSLTANLTLLKDDGYRQVHVVVAKTLRDTRFLAEEGEKSLDGDGDKALNEQARKQAKELRGQLHTLAANASGEETQDSLDEVRTVAKKLRDTISPKGGATPPAVAAGPAVPPPATPKTGRSVIPLLIEAIEKRGHLPVNGFNTIQDGSSPLTLAEWNDKADLKSLQFVSLKLPQIIGDLPGRCEMSSGTQGASNGSRRWDCHLADDSKQVIGTFELTAQSLVFHPTEGSTTLLQESLLPFLPVYISDDRSENDKDTPSRETWLQLIIPLDTADALNVVNAREQPAVIYENTMGSASEVLSAVFEDPSTRLRWRDLRIQADGHEEQLQLALPGRWKFQDVVELPDSDASKMPEALWWRPSRMAQPDSAFRELVSLSVKPRNEPGKVLLSGSAVFSCDTVIGSVAGNLPQFRKILQRDRRRPEAGGPQRDAGAISSGSWDIVVESIVKMKKGLVFPRSQKWETLRPVEKEDMLRVVYPKEGVRDDRKPLKDWVEELAKACAQDENFHQYARNKATEQLASHPFLKIGPRPQEPGPDAKGMSDEEKRQLQSRRTEWEQAEKAYNKKLSELTSKLRGDPHELMEWAELQLESGGEPTNIAVALLLWRSLYKYQSAYESGFVSSPELLSDKDEPLRDLQAIAAKASLQLSGVLELQWRRAASDEGGSEKNVLPVRIATLRAAAKESIPVRGDTTADDTEAPPVTASEQAAQSEASSASTNDGSYKK